MQLPEGRQVASANRLCEANGYFSTFGRERLEGELGILLFLFRLDFVFEFKIRRHLVPEQLSYSSSSLFGFHFFIFPQSPTGKLG